MITKTIVLTKGKQCLTPKRYQPTEAVFSRYAHLYQKEPAELFAEVQTLAGGEDDEPEDISSEEREDDEIRATDRLICALNSEAADPKVEVYLYEEASGALYVHHDIFIHNSPTSIAVLDREADPLVFVSHDSGDIAGYNLFVANHFLPDLVIEAHDEAIRDIESDSALLVSSDSTSVKGWDLATQKNLFTHANLAPAAIGLLQGMPVYAVGPVLYLKDLRAKDVQKLLTASSAITAVGTAGSAVAAGTSSGEVFWQQDGTLFRSFAHHEPVNSVAISVSQHLVSASEDGSIALTNMAVPDTLHRKKTTLEAITASVPADDRMLFAFPVNDDEINLSIESAAEYLSEPR